MSSSASLAEASGAFDIGGDLPVRRLGFGAMQLTGPGIWGEPEDPEEAIRVLRRAVELGVNFIDTADSYGPAVAEPLIRKALHPYPDDLVIATKAGLTRQGPGQWLPVGRPEYLRQQAEMSLRHLGLECIGLFQLHRIDPKVPMIDQLEELVELQEEGKVRHIGLSEVTVDQLDEARELAPIATVQNRFNLADRQSEPVLDYAEINRIAFIPWFPLESGELCKPDGALASIAASKGVTPSQLALAWLLQRSPVMLPIPGTSKVAHLEDNMAAAEVTLSHEEVRALLEAVS
jgi:aryl-alcohol dehydrogenase-like predicted oxidoreductase